MKTKDVREQKKPKYTTYILSNWWFMKCKRIIKKKMKLELCKQNTRQIK
jgi:hypothetical protein